MTYDRQIAAAQSMLRRYGAALPISRTANVTDPVAGTVATTTSSGTVYAAILPGNTTGIQALLGSGDNSLNKQFTTDKQRYVLAAAKGAPFAPDVGDKLTFDGADWTVYACTPLSPTGAPIIFKMGVGRV